MKINKIKINGFGKLQNKEIQFDEKVNLIKGENEAGKSTLLKFILSMFYGTSKNKNGKEISDFEKFKPWYTEEYSGKIEYELDNKEKYEIYREFKKKSPKIFNEKKEEITNNYSVNKGKENIFFEEQTGVKEESFFATSAVEQGEIKLNKNTKNEIIQKLSNIVSSGIENISFKKAIEKINKKQIEEIGTERSSGRPINILNDKIKKLENEKEKLSKYENDKYNIRKNEEEIEINIDEDINSLELLREQKKFLEKLELKQTRVKYLEKEISETKHEIKKEKKVNKKITYIVFFILIAIVIGIISLILNIKLLALEIIPVILIIYKLLKKEKKTKEDNIDRKKTALEIEKEEINKEINQNQKEMIKKYSNKIDEETIKEILSIDYEKVIEFISDKEREITNYKIEKKEAEINNNLIEEKLEELIQVEEKLSEYKAQRIELKNLNKIYEIVKEEINNSYNEMKENITPEFITELSKILENVTDGKYKKIYLGNNNELKVEVNNGNYVEIEKLSTGTIDLMYLALRISASKEITKEKMPILLDETFAYYDDKRLENIIKYLTEKYENQIFILSCSNREKNILDDLKISYKEINL